MWMSRLPVSHPLLRGRFGFADRDRSHKAVMSLFEERLPGEAHERRSGGGVLWRVDAPSGGVPLVSVQSSVAPANVADGVDGVRVIEISRLLDAVESAGFVRLKVDVNAVHRRGGRVTGRVGDDEFDGWFAGRLGDAADEVWLQELSWQQHRAKGAALAVASVVADVRVGDGSALRELLATGVGRAKSYGCGLMLATPLG